MEGVKSASVKRSDDRRRQRIPRACDRCRFKKSKCDGKQKCSTCDGSGRPCIYSVRHRRDARTCSVQQTVDVGIHRLFRACISANVFPGTLPDIDSNSLSTEDILRGMGLAVDLGQSAAPCAATCTSEQADLLLPKPMLGIQSHRQPACISAAVIHSKSDRHPSSIKAVHTSVAEVVHTENVSESIFDSDTNGLDMRQQFRQATDVVQIAKKSELPEVQGHEPESTPDLQAELGAVKVDRG